MEIAIGDRTVEMDPEDFEQAPDGTLRIRDDDAAFKLAWSLLADGESMHVHDPDCPVTETGECECVPRTYRKGARA